MYTQVVIRFAYVNVHTSSDQVHLCKCSDQVHLTISINLQNTVKPPHVVTSIKSNLPMWSPLLSQTSPCGHLYYVKPPHVVTSIKSNIPMWSPLLSETSPCGHLY